MSELATLRTAKQALDEGLITEADFDNVKQGFLNAQKIKAGLDAGFIGEEDYQQARDAFFESLGVSAKAPGAGGAKPNPSRPAQSSAPARKVQNGGPFGRPAGQPSAVHAANQSAPGSGSVRPSQSAVRPAAGLHGRANSLTNQPRPVAASTKTSMSGISVDENAVTEFTLMKQKSAYAWLTFKMDDTGRTVILSDTGAEKSFGDFVAALPSNECRYGVYDYHYNASEGRALDKLVFFNWAPDYAPVKAKMMFASTKDFFKNFLEGIQVELQVSDYDDLTEDEVDKAVGATLTRK